MRDIKQLTVETDDERLEWIKLLLKAVEYHRDIAESFRPQIIGADDIVYRIHTAFANSIEDAAHLVEMWEIVEGDDVISTAGPAG
tara:strand:+ start:241 stop:495 length:255 start_codon:yes stop_codon:yes gene_type:complete